MQRILSIVSGCDSPTQVVGYKIVYCPELHSYHSQYGNSVIATVGAGHLTEANLYVEAARLYVGIKRYKHICPNPFKLISFVIIYFAHITIYLVRKRAITTLPSIVRRANIQNL